MLAVQPARRLIRVKEHRALDIDTGRRLVVVGVFDSRPAQILRDAARVTPPVCQTQLHAQIVARCFRDGAIEFDKSVFIPLVRCLAKEKGARPVVEIADRFDVVGSTFAKGPNAHDFDAHTRRLAHRLRHVRAILIAIHHGYVRTGKTKRPAVNHESPSANLHESRARRWLPANQFGSEQENGRAYK